MQRIMSVRYFIYDRYLGKYFSKTYKALYGDVIFGAPSRGTNMAAGNQQNICLSVFLVLGELLKIKLIFIPREGKQNLKKSVTFLACMRAFSTAASRKRLEIQASSIAKRKTLSKRKFV